MEKKLQFADFLLNQKVITQAQLDKTLEIQKESGEKIDHVLIELGFINQANYLEYFAQYLNVPFIDLSQYKLNVALSHQIPESYARRLKAILLEAEPEGCLVGMVNPVDIFALDELSRILDRPLKLALVEEKSLLRMLDLMYRRTEEITDFAEQLETELKDLGGSKKGEVDKKTDSAVIRLIHSLFEDAVQINASDIHIEPAETILRIRFRVDGQLQEQTIEEKRIATALSQRLKLMAGLNMAERRLPQDGRFNIVIRDMSIDVRLSTMPIQYGESIVMRLLNQSSQILNLDQMGMFPEMLKSFRRLIRVPWGMILVTGPTGSGKTTTLYAAISEINDIKKKDYYYRRSS